MHILPPWPASAQNWTIPETTRQLKQTEYPSCCTRGKRSLGHGPQTDPLARSRKDHRTSKQEMSGTAAHPTSGSGQCATSARWGRTSQIVGPCMDNIAVPLQALRRMHRVLHAAHASRGPAVTEPARCAPRAMRRPAVSASESQRVGATEERARDAASEECPRGLESAFLRRSRTRWIHGFAYSVQRSRGFVRAQCTAAHPRPAKERRHACSPLGASRPGASRQLQRISVVVRAKAHHAQCAARACGLSPRGSRRESADPRRTDTGAAKRASRMALRVRHA
ncbi:hypothetical protein B0H15DRAFT_566288 [Mycena belliarum]|uniref:Uncharacterized protein n=1 Tax=Mycena belliarum TaxID=1033014 RepID=A0AAD6TRW9_9AGAR|nr:hypothetical protein B0H15DRAFT_566288 [Mycena belliae]